MKLETVKRADYTGKYGALVAHGAPPSAEALLIWEKLKACPVDGVVIIWPDGKEDLRKLRASVAGSLRRLLNRLNVKNIRITFYVNQAERHIAVAKSLREK